MILVQDILIPLSLSQGRHQELISTFCLSEPKQIPETFTKTYTQIAVPRDHNEILTYTYLYS